MSNYNVVRVTPIPGCKGCNGTGEVIDWVPYGNTNVAMPSTCDCVNEQIPEDKWDWHVEIVPFGEQDEIPEEEE